MPTVACACKGNGREAYRVSAKFDTVRLLVCHHGTQTGAHSTDSALDAPYVQQGGWSHMQCIKQPPLSDALLFETKLWSVHICNKRSIERPFVVIQMC